MALRKISYWSTLTAQFAHHMSCSTSVTPRGHVRIGLETQAHWRRSLKSPSTLGSAAHLLFYSVQPVDLSQSTLKTYFHRFTCNVILLI